MYRGSYRILDGKDLMGLGDSRIVKECGVVLNVQKVTTGHRILFI